MAAVNSRKQILTASAVLVLMLTAAFYALAQQPGEPKKSAAAPAIGKRHSLAATLSHSVPASDCAMPCQNVLNSAG